LKPTLRLRCFLALTGSFLLAICSANAQTVLADSYLTSLDVATHTTLSVTPNFPSFLSGPLTGSSNLTITGYYSSASVSAVTNPLTLLNNPGNAFSGKISIDGSSGVNAASLETISIDFSASVPLQAGGSAEPQFFRVAVPSKYTTRNCSAANS